MLFRSRQFGNKPTAMILNAQAYANATGTTLADAMKMMAPGASRMKLTPAQEINVRQKANDGLIKVYGEPPQHPGGDSSKWTPRQKQQDDDATAFEQNSRSITTLSSGGGQQAPAAGPKIIKAEDYVK